MSDLSRLAHLPDLSMRQMVFFYELCKMGVVRFDLNDPRHKAVLSHMIDLLKAGSKKEHKPDTLMRHQLFSLIIYQLIKHSIPEEGASRMSDIGKEHEIDYSAFMKAIQDVNSIILQGYVIIKPLPCYSDIDIWKKEKERFEKTKVYDELFSYVKDACDFYRRRPVDKDKIKYIFLAIYIAVVYKGKKYENWRKESFGFYIDHAEEINTFNVHLWDKIEESRRQNT